MCYNSIGGGLRRSSAERRRAEGTALATDLDRALSLIDVQIEHARWEDV
jgi:hypothetical protein